MFQETHQSENRVKHVFTDKLAFISNGVGLKCDKADHNGTLYEGTPVFIDKNGVYHTSNAAVESTDVVCVGAVGDTYPIDATGSMFVPVVTIGQINLAALNATNTTLKAAELTALKAVKGLTFIY